MYSLGVLIAKTKKELKVKQKKQKTNTVLLIIRVTNDIDALCHVTTNRPIATLPIIGRNPLVIK